MKLIDILIEELPKQGGWPVGYSFCVQDNDGTKEVKFGVLSHQLYNDCRGIWVIPDERHWGRINGLSSAQRFPATQEADDCDSAIITKEQYDLVLAAKQPASQSVNNDVPKQKPALQLVESLTDVNKTLQRKSTFTLATEFHQAGLHVIDASRKLFWCAGLLVATPDSDSSSMQTVESDLAAIIESLESALLILKGDS